eukprot:4586277-Pyramimonas_sp.AAC.1
MLLGGRFLAVPLGQQHILQDGRISVFGSDARLRGGHTILVRLLLGGSFLAVPVGKQYIGGGQNPQQ